MKRREPERMTPCSTLSMVRPRTRGSSRRHNCHFPLVSNVLNKYKTLKVQKRVNSRLNVSIIIFLKHKTTALTVLSQSQTHQKKKKSALPQTAIFLHLESSSTVHSATL